MPEGNILAQPSCLPETRDINLFGKLLRMMQWTSHCVLWQIDFMGVLFGFWSRFLLFLVFAVCFVFPLAKRKSG